jgi:hypothetical protein
VERSAPRWRDAAAQAGVEADELELMAPAFEDEAAAEASALISA